MSFFFLFVCLNFPQHHGPSLADDELTTVRKNLETINVEVSSDLVRGFIFVILKSRLSFLLCVPIYLTTFMGTIRMELRQSIVIKVEWPVMKPVGFLCYMFLLALWI